MLPNAFQIITIAWYNIWSSPKHTSPFAANSCPVHTSWTSGSSWHLNSNHWTCTSDHACMQQWPITSCACTLDSEGLVVLLMFFNAYKKFWEGLVNFVMQSATLSAVVTNPHLHACAVTIIVETHWVEKKWQITSQIDQTFLILTAYVENMVGLRTTTYNSIGKLQWQVSFHCWAGASPEQIRSLRTWQSCVCRGGHCFCTNHGCYIKKYKCTSFPLHLPHPLKPRNHGNGYLPLLSRLEEAELSANTK